MTTIKTFKITFPIALFFLISSNILMMIPKDVIEDCRKKAEEENKK